MSWSIVMAGGRECLQHDLPDFPSKQEGFGLAQAYDRYIFKCGGRTGTTDCKQIFGAYHFVENPFVKSHKVDQINRYFHFVKIAINPLLKILILANSP
jgi:hypothetical protein